MPYESYILRYVLARTVKLKKTHKNLLFSKIYNYTMRKIHQMYFSRMKQLNEHNSSYTRFIRISIKILR